MCTRQNSGSVMSELTGYMDTCILPGDENSLLYFLCWVE